MIEVARRMPIDRAERTRSTFSPRLILRAVLIAVSLVTLVPASFAVVGGYLPHLPTVGPFGAILNTGYPWITADLVLSTALALGVVGLGGRKTWLLVAVNALVLAGAILIGVRYATFASAHGASYDIVQAADGFPPIEYADARVAFASVDGADLHAELWFPGAAASAGRRSLPAVVFVHGGAFQGGAPGTRPLLLESIVREGIVVIDVEYRLAPPPRWDQAPGDVLCALAWVAGAPELAIVDPSRVVLVGESAGGSLALVAGFAAGADAISSSCPAAGTPLVPAAIVAISPTADLAAIWADASIADYGGGRFPEAYIGGSPDQYPDRYAAAEPFRLLRPDLPPTVIITGEIDKLVHVERQLDLAERIRAAGASVELLIAPFAGHGFDGEPSSFGAQFVESYVPRFVGEITR